jgi:glycosyltransferase involved in cell wall biosynthesis
VFTGRLEHDEVADLLPACEALVVPSTFPEAFGMVAAEAASTGALPVCADHSGLAEVAAALAEDLPADIEDLTAFPLSDPVPAIADRLNRWLALPDAERGRASRDFAAVVRARWSWESVARTVVSASQGEFDALAGVPAADGADR